MVQIYRHSLCDFVSSCFILCHHVSRAGPAAAFLCAIRSFLCPACHRENPDADRCGPNGKASKSCGLPTSQYLSVCAKNCCATSHIHRLLLVWFLSFSYSAGSEVMKKTNYGPVCGAGNVDRRMLLPPPPKCRRCGNSLVFSIHFFSVIRFRFMS